MDFNRIVFVGESGNSRAPMSAEILRSMIPADTLDIQAKGLVVLFPEPLNQKVEAVMASNGLRTEGFFSTPLKGEDFGENTLVLTMNSSQRDRIIQQFESAQNVYVLSEYAGDELEILNPYGQSLQVYGLCFETLQRTISRLVKKLAEGNDE